jgi:hypothetical protein
MEIEKRGEAG